MNMKKYMKKHEYCIKEQLLKESSQDWNKIKEKHERMIRNMQHERLIHLIVTLAFGILLMMLFTITLIKPYLPTLILMGLFLVLFVPYLIHYFYLENTIQRWYHLMDEIDKKINTF